MTKPVMFLGAVVSWVILCPVVARSGEAQPAANAARGFVIALESPHPWRPPFGLERVGQPIILSISTAEDSRLKGFELIVQLRGKEVARHPVTFPAKPPYSARIAIEDTGDEIVLSASKENGIGRIELARQRMDRARIEADAMARPEKVTNPVDLGTILVPSGWLVLGPGKRGVLEVAARCRDGEELKAQIRAWFGSAPGKERAMPMPLEKGKTRRLSFELSEPPGDRDRDSLHVTLVDGAGAELWRKTIPVMLVRQPPRWPRFGATYTKLRYDAPISVRDPKTGAFSSLSYERGWDPALRDVVVSLPGGARFVFWRGSSYIPFWAGKHNTGACYEWAEIISRLKDAVDCVEP